MLVRLAAARRHRAGRIRACFVGHEGAGALGGRRVVGALVVRDAAARRATAVRVVRNNLDVASTASDRRNRARARRQGAAVHFTGALPAIAFAPEDTDTAGEALRAAAN